MEQKTLGVRLPPAHNETLKTLSILDSCRPRDSAALSFTCQFSKTTENKRVPPGKIVLPGPYGRKHGACCTLIVLRGPTVVWCGKIDDSSLSEVLELNQVLSNITRLFKSVLYISIVRCFKAH